MNAAKTVRMLMKKIYDDGEVNAASIWKGYDAFTGRTGWHYQGFNESAQAIGKNLDEVQEYVEDILASRESA